MFVVSLRSFVNSSINTKPFTTLLSTLDLLLKKPNLFLSPSIFTSLDKHWVFAGGLSVSCCVTLARTSGGCCPGPRLLASGPHHCTDCCRHSDGRGEWRKYLNLSIEMLCMYWQYSIAEQIFRYLLSMVWDLSPSAFSFRTCLLSINYDRFLFNRYINIYFLDNESKLLGPPSSITHHCVLRYTIHTN